MPWPVRTDRADRAAFSLVELIVVIALVALLLALLMPALGRSKDLARQTRAASGMRQMMIGYTAYQVDFRGKVVWGYTPSSIGGVAVTITATDGRTYGLPIADRYPWRLAPYISGIWSILHHHQPATPPLPRSDDTLSEAMLKAYALSITPSFGINSAYVGGHEGPWQGFVVKDGQSVPNVGQHVVFSAAEVRRPSGLLVFSESQARHAPFSDPQEGMHFVTPPRAKGHRWHAAGDSIQTLMPGVLTGVPLGRYGRAAVTGFFDGHVSALPPATLEDMRLWANHADAPDADPIP